MTLTSRFGLIPIIIEEALHFDQIAVGVFDEKVIDAVIVIGTWRVFTGDALGRDALVPRIDILRDEGEDHAVWLTRDFALADTDVRRAPVDVVNATPTLIEREFQTEGIFVKRNRGLNIGGVQECDLFIDR